MFYWTKPTSQLRNISFNVQITNNVLDFKRANIIRNKSQENHDCHPLFFFQNCSSIVHLAEQCLGELSIFFKVLLSLHWLIAVSIEAPYLNCNNNWMTISPAYAATQDGHSYKIMRFLSLLYWYWYVEVSPQNVSVKLGGKDWRSLWEQLLRTTLRSAGRNVHRWGRTVASSTTTKAWRPVPWPRSGGDISRLCVHWLRSMETVLSLVESWCC